MNNRDYLGSVSKRIAGAILDFCRLRVGREFHADELRQHVELVTGRTAPASADRVLRDLRLRGLLYYTVTNRHDSLYYLHRVDPA